MRCVIFCMCAAGGARCSSDDMYFVVKFMVSTIEAVIAVCFMICPTAGGTKDDDDNVSDSSHSWGYQKLR